MADTERHRATGPDSSSSSMPCRFAAELDDHSAEGVM
jgi:hypothetical protein